MIITFYFNFITYSSVGYRKTSYLLIVMFSLKVGQCVVCTVPTYYRCLIDLWIGHLNVNVSWTNLFIYNFIITVVTYVSTNNLPSHNIGKYVFRHKKKKLIGKKHTYTITIKICISVNEPAELLLDSTHFSSC